jgi:malonate transporter and related proteins
VILAALPTGALIFVLAQQYGIYVQRATSVILISTVVSVVTLSALFVLLGVS